MVTDEVIEVREFMIIKEAVSEVGNKMVKEMSVL